MEFSRQKGKNPKDKKDMKDLLNKYRNWEADDTIEEREQEIKGIYILLK